MFLLLFLVASFLFVQKDTFALTLDEALERSFSYSYVLKEQQKLLEKSKFSYLSTIDPYLPRLDLKASYTRTLSPLGALSYPDSREQYSLGAAISYRIFDGGERYSKRKQAYLSYGKDLEYLRALRQELAYTVKKCFFSALGKKKVLETKKEAFEISRRVYEITKGRYEAGVAKKSDVLQAQLRMESAMIEYENAKVEYEKSLEILRSYVFAREGENIDVEGTLYKPDFQFKKEDLIKGALKKRPEILIQKMEIKRLEMLCKEKESAYYPKVDAEIQHIRKDTSFFPEERSDQFILSFTFPLFDGVGRYYAKKGVESEISAAKSKLAEIKRKAELEIVTALKQYELSLKNVEFYEKLVAQAKVSFEQLLGEYQVGKGDILSVLSSEKDFTSARERYVEALAEANISLFDLERVSALKEY